MKNRELFLQKNIVVWFGALICCALWGSAFPCIKIGYQWMNIASDDTATQILYAGYRFTLAGILAIILGSVAQKHFIRPTFKTVPKVMQLSMLQTILQYLFFYIGLAHTTGVKASIIEGVNVFVAVLVAAIIFKQEKLSARKIVGCIIGFAGVVAINVSGKGIDMNLSIFGEGFIFLSTVAYAFSSVLLKNYSKTENPVMLSAYQFLFGGIIMSAIGIAFGGNISQITTKAVLMLLWLAFVSAAAYSLWGILLKYNPISKVAVFGFMNPVFGVILSAILLREADSLGITAILALGLVCLGIYIVNRKNDVEE